jgi:multiple antibiotic resistance protein
MKLLSAVVTLFLIMDPIGNIPFFLSALKDVREERRLKVILRELVIAFGVMLVFLFAGKSLLDVLHVRQESISVAGGIVLFLISLRMVFPQEGIASTEPTDPNDGEPFIVPLAIPFVAGPSILATILLLQRSGEYVIWDLVLATFCAWAASTVILLLSPGIAKLLGRRGLTAIERLMGMLVVMISVQMFVDGLSQYLKQG